MKNKIIIKDGYAEIFLKRRNKEIVFTLIDEEEISKLTDLNLTWCATWNEHMQQYYANATKYLGIVNGKYKYEKIYLHRLIMGFPEGKDIDHINHDTLDNRKSNLKIKEHQKNILNRLGANKNTSTGIRNVSYSKRDNKYLVQFQVDGKNTCFGKFNLEDFEKAVDLANKLRQEIYNEK